MPRIAAVSTAVPAHEVTQEDSMAVARLFFQDAYPDIDRLLTVFSHSQIRKRYFCMPLDWFGVAHGFAEKNRLFLEHAEALGTKVGKDCLERAGCTPAQIDCLLFVTSTGIATPSMDARLINRLGMRPDTTRLPLWGLGCAGGAMGLARACEYVRAFPQRRALLISVELCGLTFIRNDLSKSNLVATCLFGDGAAAVLVEGDEVPRTADHAPHLYVCGSESRTWRDTLDVMGWEMTEAGLKVIFSRDIPPLIHSAMRENVDSFLGRMDSSLQDLTHFIFHPGGAKVLTAYQQALDLPPSSTRFSEHVLNEYGNMSSPTVLFVLEKSLETAWSSGEKGLLAALGPGFSSELLLLEAR
ncbi:type III polyketide synthase [Brevibacillus ruminantium]|uniref:Type III polyketide synthase n=1 Tax=Brevibacillus ruminantium TaxID=2950604 RepID=A0ABY4WLR4_9BACL|nr:3-oxoacyl-[acyl-carrier-protein] synthase III C-terminal domain-containing protein [Brevibacillus ruminantium]USG67711.1 type III polyketide synthase [Brevibacillus ruminantium]